MKKTITLAIAFLMNVVVFAQAPEMMSYQAVIRDAADNLVASSPIGMKISILQGSPSGIAAYVETHTPTSNQNGLISIEIGNGTIVSGDFAAIDWTNGPYFVKSETDPTGGTSYTITGISQLLSVPYALHAGNAYWEKHPTQDKVRYTGQVGVRGYPGSHDTLVDLKIYSLPEPFSEGTIRLTGTNENTSYSQWTDLKSSYDGYITSSKFSIYTRNKGEMNENFVINSLGYTGIGISSPVANFHLQNRGFSNLLIESTGSVEDASVWLKNPSKTWRLHGDQNDDNKFKIGLWTDYSETGGLVELQHAMTIDTSGNVGIGTSSPSSLFHVFGLANKHLLTLSTNSSTQPYSTFTSRTITFRDTISSAFIGLTYEPPSSSLSINNEPTIGFYTAASQGPNRHFNIRFNGANRFTVSGNGVTSINSIMKLIPRNSVPSNPEKGWIYFNNTTNKLMVFDGNIWQSCW